MAQFPPDGNPDSSLRSRDRRFTSGRDFVGDMSTRTKKQPSVMISFPRQDLGILEIVSDLVSKGTGTMSELVRIALYNTYGSSMMGELKTSILERYANRELEGPKLFSTFEEVLSWEIQHRPINEIPELWGCTRRELGLFLLELCLNSEPVK